FFTNPGSSCDCRGRKRTFGSDCLVATPTKPVCATTKGSGAFRGKQNAGEPAIAGAPTAGEERRPSCPSCGSLVEPSSTAVRYCQSSSGGFSRCRALLRTN